MFALEFISSVIQRKMAQTMSVQEISKGWSFKQTDTEEWMGVARVPTNVHLDLMDNQKCVTSVTSVGRAEADINAQA